MYLGRDNWNIGPSDAHCWNSCSHNRLLEGIVFNLLYSQDTGAPYSINLLVVFNIVWEDLYWLQSKYLVVLNFSSFYNLKVWVHVKLWFNRAVCIFYSTCRDWITRYPRNSCSSGFYWSLKRCKLVINRHMSIWQHYYGYGSILVYSINDWFYFPSQWPACSLNRLLEFWDDVRGGKKGTVDSFWIV